MHKVDSRIEIPYNNRDRTIRGINNPFAPGGVEEWNAEIDEALERIFRTHPKASEVQNRVTSTPQRHVINLENKIQSPQRGTVVTHPQVLANTTAYQPPPKTIHYVPASEFKRTIVENNLEREANRERNRAAEAERYLERQFKIEEKAYDKSERREAILKNSFERSRERLTRNLKGPATRTPRGYRSTAAMLGIVGLSSFLPYSAPVGPATTEAAVVMPSMNEVIYTHMKSGILGTYPVADREKEINSLSGKRVLPKNMPGTLNHPGNDYRARPGDYVLAVSGGKVVHVGRTHLTIENQGFEYKMLHIRPRVTENTTIEEGDTLGVVARARWPHLDMRIKAKENGIYSPLKEKIIEPLCFFENNLREEMITNIENQTKRPSGLRYLPGKTVREKLYGKCERQAELIADAASAYQK